MTEEELKRRIINVQYILYGHETALADLEDKLETDLIDGLDNKEADRRLPEFGKNEIYTAKPNVWKLYLAPLFDVLITTYLIMTLIMLVLSFFVEGVTSKISLWIIMITFNMILAIYQQFKAQKKIEALLKLSPPRARIIRQAERGEILASHLVPGDVIELAIGDKVPADCRIIRSSNLTVNEASLTGESQPVEKLSDGNEVIEVGTPISQHSNFLYLGTYIQTGSCSALIVRTGNNTEIGKIADAMSSNVRSLDMPLRNKINTLGKILALIMITFLILRMVFVTNLQMSRDGAFITDKFLFNLVDSIIIAMSAIPVNIPLLVTVILISGVLNMASNRVVVKNLSTIETLGRCSVLCSDKTGTLTTSKMSVKLIWDSSEYYGTTFRDINYTITSIPEYEINDFLELDVLNQPPKIKINPGSTLELVLTSAVLNNDAILQFNNTQEDYTDYDIIGDSTDGALLVLALAQGFEEDRIKKRYRKFQSYPFDSKLRRMSGLFRDTKEGDYMIYTKGATEVILSRCIRIGDEDNNIELNDEIKESIQDKVDYFGENGYRVISLAYRSIETLPSMRNKREERTFIEKDLTYIGFMVIYDPPRPGAREAVAQLDSAGIFPIMITGDSIKTATTIAHQVGILDGDGMVVEGRLASELPDDEFFKVSVFARVSPQDKEIIVSRYQKRGDVVTMTGDGINDALAISKSDAGVAMGITGTDVTKESADLIITDDSITSLVNGVKEGRNLFEKIRIMIFFYLTINLAEATLYFITSFIPDFHLITPWQRIYIFSIVHAAPVLAIIFGPSDHEIMKLKPRSNDAIIPRPLVKTLFVFSLSYFAILSLLYYLVFQGIIPLYDVNYTGYTNSIIFLDPVDPTSAIHLSQAKARTILIAVMYLTESFFVLSIRRINSSVWKGIKDTNPFIWVMVLLGPVINLIVLTVPNVQLRLLERGASLDFVPLHIYDILIILVFTLIPLTIFELYKKRLRSKDIQL